MNRDTRKSDRLAVVRRLAARGGEVH